MCNQILDYSSPTHKTLPVQSTFSGDRRVLVLPKEEMTPALKDRITAVMIDAFDNYQIQVTFDGFQIQVTFDEYQIQVSLSSVSHGLTDFFSREDDASSQGLALKDRITAVMIDAFDNYQIQVSLCRSGDKPRGK